MALPPPMACKELVSAVANSVPPMFSTVKEMDEQIDRVNNLLGTLFERLDNSVLAPPSPGAHPDDPSNVPTPREESNLRNLLIRQRKDIAHIGDMLEEILYRLEL